MLAKPVLSATLKQGWCVHNAQHGFCYLVIAAPPISIPFLFQAELISK